MFICHGNKMEKKHLTSTKKNQFKSLLKAIDLLSILEIKTALSVAEISDSVGLPLSTTYKYLSILKECRFVDYDRSLEKYKLGMKLFELGGAVQNLFAIDRIAHPYLEELSNLIEETVVLNVMDGNSTVYLESVDPESPRAGIVLSIRRGTRHPLHAGAAGKILLAYQPEERIEQYITSQQLEKFTENTVVDPDKLRKHLKAIRKAGCAFSEEEITPGFTAFAAPIFDHKGDIIAGLFVLGPVQRIASQEKEKIVKLILEYSIKISERIKGKRL
jgi:IclR family KDG regulon transcriptional repressor